MYEEGLPVFWTRFENAGFRWLARIVSGGGTTGSTVGNMFDDSGTSNIRNTPAEIGKETWSTLIIKRYEGPITQV